jgi:hypothetical protein
MSSTNKRKRHEGKTTKKGLQGMKMNKKRLDEKVTLMHFHRQKDNRQLPLRE